MHSGLNEGVTARAWCRADLAGGTLDIWPLGLLFPGSRTVNVALDLPVDVTVTLAADGRYRVTSVAQSVDEASVHELARSPVFGLVGVVLEHLDAPAVTVDVDSSSPRGGGLGASSAMTVALIAAADRALGRPGRSVDQTVALARDLEARLMSLPTGCQDHYPALRGGALVVRHRPGGPVAEELPVDLDRLGRHLIIVDSGASHFSAGTNWGIIRGCLEADAAVRSRFEGIVEAAAAVETALAAGDLEGVGRWMSSEWAHRRELAPGVSVPVIERLLEAGAAAGAWGGKACGAGGGGCLALVAPEGARAAVVERLEAAGGRVLPARPTARGLRLTAVAPDGG